MKSKTPFSKLSKQEKRIVILKDALSHLKAGRMRAHKGSIIKIDDGNFGTGIQKFCGIELQQVIKSNPCRVCQRGAILFSMVWRMDNYIIDETDMGVRVSESEATPNKFVEQLFMQKQLAMMEAAFEGDYGYGLTEDVLHKCFRFYDNHYGAPEDRMEAILKNAIKNKGIFKP
jgi:hypothetical protein